MATEPGLWLDGLTGRAARLGLHAMGLVGGTGLSILMFHRVSDKADQLFPEDLDALRFERQMCMVARAFRVVSLESAILHLRNGTLPSRSMVITFDDGYADNAEVALPILRRQGLTATFFVSTGFLDGGIMWNDAVIETLRRSPRDDIDLDLLGLGRRPLRDARDRRRAVDEVLMKVKYLSLAEREVAIRGLMAAASVSALPGNLMMRSDQVRQLHEAGMSIGAHTVRHPILAKLPPDEARNEIDQGRRRLEAITQAPVQTLAYPNGKPGRDFLPEHVAMARSLGFLGAVTTAAGVARPGDDLFQLPRYTPWGASSAAWAMRLLVNQRNRSFLAQPEPGDRQMSTG